MVCARVPLAKSAKNVSVRAEGNLEAIEFSSDPHMSGLPGSAVALLSAPDGAFPDVTRRAKRPAVICKSPRTQKKLASGGGKIKLTVLLAMSSSAKPAFSSQSRFLSVNRSKRSRRLRSSASFTLCTGIVDDDGTLVMLFDRHDYGDEASS